MNRMQSFTKAAADKFYPDERGYYSTSPIPKMSQTIAEWRSSHNPVRLQGLSFRLREWGRQFERKGIFERVVNGDYMAQVRGHNMHCRLDLLSRFVEHHRFPNEPYRPYDIFDFNGVITALTTGDKQTIDAKIKYVNEFSWDPESVSSYFAIAVLYLLLTNDNRVESVAPHLESTLAKSTRYWKGVNGALLAIIRSDANTFISSLKEILATSATQNNVFIGTNKYFVIPAHGLYRLFNYIHPDILLDIPKQKLWDQEFHSFATSLSLAESTATEDLEPVDRALNDWICSLPEDGKIPDFGFRVSAN